MNWAGDSVLADGFAAAGSDRALICRRKRSVRLVAAGATGRLRGLGGIKRSGGLDRLDLAPQEFGPLGRGIRHIVEGSHAGLPQFGAGGGLAFLQRGGQPVDVGAETAGDLAAEHAERTKSRFGCAEPGFLKPFVGRRHDPAEIAAA